MLEFIIIFLIFFGIIFGLNYYFYRKLNEFYPKLEIDVWIYSAIGAALIFLLMLAGEFMNNKLAFYLGQLVYYDIGILGVAFFWFVIYDIIKIVYDLISKNIKISMKKKKKFIEILRTFTIVIIVIHVLLSIIIFEKGIVLNQYDLYSDKVTKEYNVLQITDPQYGSVGTYHLERIRKLADKTIEENNVDLIVFTGDFIDTGNYEREDLEPLLGFDIPVFFSYGNHEFYHEVGKISDIVYENYTVLRDGSQTYEELNLIGFDDSSDEKIVLRKLYENEFVINDKFNILLYHRPSGVDDAKDKGIDLMVTGHTHGGQLWPYSLTLKLVFEYPQGLVQLDDFYLYTSDGAGLWGPKMRLGSENEITLFTIKPKE